MNENNAVDFQSLWKPQSIIAPRSLTIVGGIVKEATTAAWLKQWDVGKLRWRLWESVSTIQLEEGTPLPDVQWLERGRIFGEAGDLTLRRDGDQFRWWFVGDKDFTLPENHGGHDFWTKATHQGKTFYVVEQEAILWGAYQKEKVKVADQEIAVWHDDRVGYAKLHYPASLAGNRHVYAKYREYLDGGRVAFVWIYGLGAKGGDHGDWENQKNCQK